MDRKNVIILCQAPADMQFALALYENNRHHGNVSILVINVRAMYEFLSSLNLELAHLEFIPYGVPLSYRKIYAMFSERKRIGVIWQDILAKFDSGDVYFFSRFEDWLTGALLHRFYKQRTFRLHYWDHYDNSSELFPHLTKIGPRLRLMLLVYKFVTGVTFYARVAVKVPEFPVDKYPVERVAQNVDFKLLSKYLFRLPEPLRLSSLPKVLLFIAPCEEIVFNKNGYNERCVEIVDTLKNAGFSIVVKGHPRTGLPPGIAEASDYQIPAFVPAEFVAPDGVAFCVGLFTTALCHFAKGNILPTYSLLRMFDVITPATLDRSINYLNQQADNRMRFCDDIENLKKIAKELSE